MKATPQAGEEAEASYFREEGSMSTRPVEGLEGGPASFSHHLGASLLEAVEGGSGYWTGALGVQRELFLAEEVSWRIVDRRVIVVRRLGGFETRLAVVVKQAVYTSSE